MGARVDLDALVGLALPTTTYTWTRRDVALYALAVGAGADDPAELALSWPREGPHAVLPTFPVLSVLGHSLRHVRLPGLTIGSDRSLHAAQRVELGPEPIPVSGTVVTTGTVAEVTATSRGALVRRVSVSHADQIAGPVVWTNTTTSYIRGGVASAREPSRPPDRVTAPTAVFAVATSTNQALLYGLTGDANPVHGDNEAARAAGLSEPILHGLCTLGLVVRELVRRFADGAWTAVTEVDVRFVAPVVPGERITVVAEPRSSGWTMEAWTSGLVMSGSLALR